MNRLDNKVALISGAARGIGAETPRLMSQAGARVAVADVLSDVGQATVQSIADEGGDALYLDLDVSREDSWTAAVAAAVGHFGRLDILVNNAGLVGAPLDPLYSMTKGGVTVFTKSTALDFARKNDRVRVNSVHPGVIDTEMGQQTIDTGASMFTNNDRDLALQRSIQRHPMGRLGTVDDIARAIVFLASDDAGFMTGSSLVVDGGLTAA